MLEGDYNCVRLPAATKARIHKRATSLFLTPYGYDLKISKAPSHAKVLELAEAAFDADNAGNYRTELSNLVLFHIASDAVSSFIETLLRLWLKPEEEFNRNLLIRTVCKDLMIPDLYAEIAEDQQQEQIKQAKHARQQTILLVVMAILALGLIGTWAYQWYTHETNSVQEVR